MGNDKTVTIVVEGKPYDWPKNTDISYDQVVKLEVPDYTPQSNITYSVKWTKGHGEKPEGILVPGASVKVKDGIRFTVSETGQS
ncbi:multiubiquitin domain-containing protein [Hydrogenophaga sp.]|uniref:multiubiquitin domain-containing protein n=1 Tax=Hydrogenophaga sp. TaxID=1904254 RepID=UPI0025BFAE6A|nr:multiubiquitin domain-containing protein [Hydrogenophaga sp.]MBT9465543.1 multiubiquitin domain-containing protein [Hydrogenophaga sp.]